MRKTSRIVATAAVVSLTVLLTACGGSGKASRDRNADTASSDTASANNSADNAPLPAECTLAPFTAHVVRDGGIAAGSDSYQVIGAAALQIPLVPDKAQTLPPEQAIQMGNDTDLIGYGLLFGDEAFGVDDVSLFSGYAPVAAGKTRGVVSIYPSTLTPLAVGDVVTPQPMDALNMYTTLSNIGIDFKTAPDEYMGYTGAVRGSVTILGLNDDSLCISVDLAWDASDIATNATGTLTIQGIFTAPLAARTLPLG